MRPSAEGLLAEIIERCSRFDPQERCSFAEAVEMLSAGSLATQAMRLAPGPPGAGTVPAQPPRASKAAGVLLWKKVSLYSSYDAFARGTLADLDRDDAILAPLRIAAHGLT